ncbi:hypothetical protein E3P99_01340 [Wallemia hederae]|uniref:HMG box domain-containing protein n=1 Tax=Wallemia hederae TaxID=1540922 RepID=A0A4T0FQR9_9BASI|nr:hypothetical protein E3P99_01340 [Wallemia hederae]
MAIAANSTKSPTKTPKSSKKESKGEVKQEDKSSKQSPQSKKRTADGSPKEEKTPTTYTPLENKLFETLANSARAMDTQLKLIKKIFYDNDRDLPLTQKALKPQKDPEAPKRPASAYLLFQNDERSKKDPNQSQTDFMSQVGKNWNSLKPEEKQKYQERYQNSIEIFERERDAYVKSGKEAAWIKKGDDEGFATAVVKDKSKVKKPAAEKTEKKADKKEAKEEPKAKASKKEEKKEAAPPSKKAKKEEKKPEPEPVEESEESESDSDEESSDSDSGSEESESESDSDNEPEPPKKAAKKDNGKKSKK